MTKRTRISRHDRRFLVRFCYYFFFSVLTICTDGTRLRGKTSFRRAGSLCPFRKKTKRKNDVRARWFFFSGTRKFSRIIRIRIFQLVYKSNRRFSHDIYSAVLCVSGHTHYRKSAWPTDNDRFVVEYSKPSGWEQRFLPLEVDNRRY